MLDNNIPQHPPLPPCLATKEDRREFIFGLEEAIKNEPTSADGDFLPLEHKFCDGMYVREIYIPSGMLLTGKIHKHEHPNFLLQGTVTMITEDGGLIKMSAPQSLVSPAGCKRAIYTHTDVRWSTVHVTESKCPEEAVEQLTVASYEEFERYLEEN
jgi:hypothetical protein|tara:strand:+ start:5884 stop:6351 length:468 start_codon:yes stop_codon:yes gene_type:complete